MTEAINKEVSRGTLAEFWKSREEKLGEARTKGQFD
jgi:hypothetical protein